MDEQTRSDLEGALSVAQDHWEQVGHCVQTCLLRHINGERGRYTVSDQSSKRLTRAFKALGFDLPVKLFYWNDTPGRTKDDVLNRIKDALNRE